jgi:hypothetical protein
MDLLTTGQVREACRLFLELAYPGGMATVPPAKRFLLDLPDEAPALEYLADLEAAKNCCQVSATRPDGKPAFSIRLGCVHFPHLKLKVQSCRSATDANALAGRPALPDCQKGLDHVFSVDTHDAFAPGQFFPPPGHAEAEAWREVQRKNALLKQAIEAAWESAGILTFNALLRRDLASSHRPA